MLSLCPLLFLAIVCFLLLGTVKIPRRPFLHILVRMLEILWGGKKKWLVQGKEKGQLIAEGRW
jgi:hypothetical protein